MSDLRLPDMNKVYLVGRLTRDPELRYLPSGTALCKLGLAVSRNYRTREGERREDTTFLNVSVWEKQAEFIGENLQKGRPVLIEGSLQSNEWEDKNTGQKRTMIEVRAQRVQPLDWDDRGGSGQRSSGGGGRQQSQGDEEPVPEDDIPF
jgi:single-strand DNA-binding protein